MEEDAYVRLSRGATQIWGQPSGRTGLLFLDVEPDAQLKQLRTLPFDLLRDAPRVLMRARNHLRRGSGGLLARAPDRVQPALGLIGRTLGVAGPDDSHQSPSRSWLELKEVVDRHGLLSDIGVLHQPIGGVPWIEAETDWPTEETCDRARAIELTALLAWSQAVWRSKNYHYLLPSGEHSEGFIRAASAIGSYRDAGVMASWLRPHARPGLGIVLDTGTLTPLVLALQADMSRAGMTTGPVETLSSYPANDFDVRRAVQNAYRRSAVVAILSVSSSGALRDRLVAAMAALDGSGPANRGLRAVEVLISKEQVSSHEERHDRTKLRVWHPQPGAAPFISRDEDYSAACPLCQDDERSLLIPIDPKTFETTVPGSIKRRMPSTKDPDVNRRLWEQCDRTDAIGLEVPPGTAVERYRPTGPMSIRIDLSKLVSSRHFLEAAAASIRSGIAELPEPVKADTALILDSEDGAELRSVISDLTPELGGHPLKVLTYPREGDWPDELIDGVKEAEGIVIFAMGSVTGTTLQRALVAAQRHRERSDPHRLTGIVLHARLSDSRAWQTLRNSYGRRLVFGFRSFLPIRSPLVDERKSLDNLSDAAVEANLSTEAQQFLEARREFCHRPSAHLDTGLCWGSEPTDKVSANSIFGEGLKAPAVYVAVCSALESVRQQSGAAESPRRDVFDMPAILRSYYDPLIVSAMLRWIRPSEKWWGKELSDAESAINELLQRGTDENSIIIPELLLAGAQGKLVSPALEAARVAARMRLDDSALDAKSRAPLELGLLLASSSTP